MQKMHNTMTTYHAIQIPDTLANVTEKFLKNSFEVSSIKFLKKVI